MTLSIPLLSIRQDTPEAFASQKPPTHHTTSWMHRSASAFHRTLSHLRQPAVSKTINVARSFLWATTGILWVLADDGDRLHTIADWTALVASSVECAESIAFLTDSIASHIIAPKKNQCDNAPLLLDDSESEISIQQKTHPIRERITSCFRALFSHHDSNITAHIFDTIGSALWLVAAGFWVFPPKDSMWSKMGDVTALAETAPEFLFAVTQATYLIALRRFISQKTKPPEQKNIDSLPSGARIINAVISWPQKDSPSACFYVIERGAWGAAAVLWVTSGSNSIGCNIADIIAAIQSTIEFAYTTTDAGNDIIKQCILSLSKKKKIAYNYPSLAQVVKLVDTPDLGSGTARCGGSSPLLGIDLDDTLSRHESEESV